MLLQACEDFHMKHSQDPNPLIESIELLNAVRLAAQRGGVVFKPCG
jgi:hypothetical protein